MDANIIQHNKKYLYFLVLSIFILSITLGFTVSKVSSEKIVFSNTESNNSEVFTVDFYYQETCGECTTEIKPIIEEVEEHYSQNNSVVINYKKAVDHQQTYHKYTRDYGKVFLILKNSSDKEKEIVPETDITDKNSVINRIEQYIEKIKLLQVDFQIFFYYNETNCQGFCLDKLQYAQNISDFYENNESVVFKIKNSTENPGFYKNQSSIHGKCFLYMSYGETEEYVNNNSLNSTESFKNFIQDFYSKHRIVFEDKETDENIIELDLLGWHIEINTDEYSLPLLAVVLGGLDSLNPCAFFILIFLLNLLIYARSRKRMLLIGLVFIFFSGLLYMVFMFLMYNALLNIQTQENVTIISLIIGCIVLPMGVLNIKDFFFFKKGASLSIPEEKKPKIFKQMRDLVKNPRLTAVLIGTILLAGTVNFYELLCTLGLPFVFTGELARRSISEGSSSYFMYILIYNIVYVIPLICIVLFFVLTLGKRKITEWHGRIMKLLSGIMLTCFGIIFLIDYKILENIFTPLLLLILSILVTLTISFIWKKFNLVEQG